MRLYSRNANDWTARLPAIAAAAERIKAKSFTIDGEAVVLGADGCSTAKPRWRGCCAIPTPASCSTNASLGTVRARSRW